MADQEPTTPVPLPVTSQVRVIPYILEPRELDALLAIGDHLANISARLTALMGEPAAFNRHARRLADELIAILDASDPDPDLEEGGDLEPNLAGAHTDLEGDDADSEPSLGASACDARMTILNASEAYHDRTSSQLHWGAGPRQDLEEEHDGREPSLCGLTVGSGDDGDLEGEHDGCEPDAEDEDPRQPVRLDVALAGEEAAHG